MSEGTTFFGQWLRQRRRSLDLTQTELAKLIGCSVVNIRKLEAGERRPSRHMACLLADRLGIGDDQRPGFIQFARTDREPQTFRHPLFVEPAASNHKEIQEEFDGPEDIFQGDFPGWVEVISTETTLVLSNRLLIARFHSAPIDSPRSEILNDGRRLCKISSMGRVVGEISGTMQQEITQVHKSPDRPNSIADTAAIFSIETEAGVIKGGCSGFMTRREGNKEHVELHGKIYAVTDGYADLLMADVSLESEVIMVPNGIKDLGVLKIVPR